MTAINARVSIWTVTTDGDNIGIETTVYPSEASARADVVKALTDAGCTRCEDGQPIKSGSLSELSDAWERTFDGACIIEQHTLSAPLAEGEQ